MGKWLLILFFLYFFIFHTQLFRWICSRRLLCLLLTCQALNIKNIYTPGHCKLSRKAGAFLESLHWPGVYIFFAFRAWHVRRDWIKNNVTEWRLTKVIWKINGYNFKVYSSGPLCISNIFLVPRLVLRGFLDQLPWLNLDAEQRQLPENFLVRASVKQLSFHFLGIAATLSGKKLGTCFLLLYLYQRYTFFTFFGYMENSV